MKLNIAYRFELDPKPTQLSLLRQFAGTARFAYSWGLFKWKEAYTTSSKGLDAYKLGKLWVQERPEWADPKKGNISKCVAQKAFMNLDSAFKRFFKQQAKYPKPKKRSHGDSFKLDGSIRVNAHSIQLPRLGKIRTKEWIHLPKNIKITSATVKREADRWFVSLTATREWTPNVKLEGAVAVDLGLKTLLTCFDGKTTKQYHSNKSLRRNESKLKRLSREHSRKQKGSNNRKKSAMKLARLHMRIRNQRTDQLHKITTELAKTKQLLIFEDLNVKGMMRNHKLAKSIADASFGRLLTMAEYKSQKYGGQLIKVDRWFASSKLCSNCGYHNGDLKLQDRDWACPDCGIIHDRDNNAAINLYNEGMRLVSTGSSPGSGVSRSQSSVAAETKGNEACGAATLPAKKAGCS